MNTTPIDLRDGRAHEQGLGVFTRVGIADKTTNPVDFALSGGIGGRGMFVSRENDTYGVGYFYNDIEESRITSVLAPKGSSQGFECFYDFAFASACHVTLDAQIVEPVTPGEDTATILGIRAGLKF